MRGGVMMPHAYAFSIIELSFASPARAAKRFFVS